MRNNINGQRFQELTQMSGNQRLEALWRIRRKGCAFWRGGASLKTRSKVWTIRYHRISHRVTVRRESYSNDPAWRCSRHITGTYNRAMRIASTLVFERGALQVGVYGFANPQPLAEIATIYAR